MLPPLVDSAKKTNRATGAINEGFRMAEIVAGVSRPVGISGREEGSYWRGRTTWTADSVAG